MKILVRLIIALALLIGKPADSGTPIRSGEQKPVIPKSGPCRIRDGQNPDLFVMTLGDVVPPIAQGTYDPATDMVTMADGTLKPHYFRETLGLAYFHPMDKSIFPLPPSGYCTWSYYYQDVNENEVIKNARWIAENLKDYGAQYVQVDDGWQKETAEGGHGSRDWTGADKAFPGGMASLAAAIKSFGLTPGIWIAPHGQSNETVVRQTPGVFMFKPDGTSASVSWEGKFLVDPSVPATMDYLKKLFTRMTDWGYEYFKIDGQPTVVDEFRQAASYMKNPGDAVKLYRETIAAIREAIGPNRYLLGCWGTPVEGADYMNGSRTGGDIVLGWDGFLVALDATMRWYFTHNILWYADPDVVCVRPPLTLDQARVWATLQGLTGQALLTSDRLPDLSEERVRLLRRIYPAADIRPLDLFPSPRNKKIWDLKVNHLGRSYDVVGVFNFDASRQDHVAVNWQDLGLSGEKPVHVFDFWNDEYVGAWEGGISVALAPTSCRVLTLVPASDRIQLVSTNRHLTQGWVDLASLSANPEGTAFSGRSRLIKNDPYELHFAFPRGKSSAVVRASARIGSQALPVRIFNHQGWATVRIDPSATAEAEWDVAFEAADSYTFPTRSPERLRLKRAGLDGIDLQWDSQYYLNEGYQVLLDDRLMGFTGDTVFPFRNLDPNRTYTAEVRAVWKDASIGPRHKPSTLQFSPGDILPGELSLSAIEPLPAEGEWDFGPRTIRIAGRGYEDGIAMSAGGHKEYDIRGLYGDLAATVAVDDGSPDETLLEFVVTGDGRELWRSGPLRKTDGAKSVRVDVGGIRRLSLGVTSAAAGETDPWQAFRLQGDWADAKLSGLRKTAVK